MKSRLVSLETSDMPMAVPDPDLMELLPSNDHEWDRGRIAASQALYTSSFSSKTAIGPFARSCQAAHMLGKVIRHKATKDSRGCDDDLLSEAFNIHHALATLQASLEEPSQAEESTAYSKARLITLSICVSARLLLYNQYGCNNSFDPVAHRPTATETELQVISLEGVQKAASHTAPRIARGEEKCPLTAQCLYYAAAECMWLVKEDHEPHMNSALRDLVRGLRDLQRKWQVGGKLFRAPSPRLS